MINKMKFLKQLELEFLECDSHCWISSDSDNLDEEGIIYMQFNELPYAKYSGEIISVTFLAYEDEWCEYKIIQSYLDKISSLEVLSLPIEWMAKINIPKNIKALRLLNTICSDEGDIWPKDLFLQRLKYLKIP